MTNWLWRVIEARLRRLLPPNRLGPVLADLAEDHTARRRQGTLRAAMWLIRESQSLVVAYRTRNGGPWRLASFLYDARSAIRGVRSRRWSFLAIAGMLGLAIGIATAMFTVVDALMLRPVPFKNPEQLARLSMEAEHGGGWVSSSIFMAWRESRVFASVEAASTDDSVLIGTDAGEIPRSPSRVTPGIFNLLGSVRPVLGRLFDVSDGLPGNDDRILVAEDLWRTGYHADPAIIGRRINLDGRAVVIVGVLPSEFHFPNWNTQIWKPFQIDLNATGYAGAVPTVVRFAPNVPRQDALNIATTQARAAEPGPRTASLTAKVSAVSELDVDKKYRLAVPLISAGVLLLFLVLCANVSSLQLAGLTARQGEMATRAALGAARSRLIVQAFVESAMAGAGGVVVGLGIGWALLLLAQTWLFDAFRLHTLNPGNLDLRALGVTSIAGLLATLGAGVLPAIVGTRVDVNRSLQSAGRRSSESRHTRAATRALLVAQIALSCTLLLGATLLVRSFVKLMNADRGFDASRILVASIQMPSSASKDPAWRLLATRAIREQALTIPGTSQAAWSYGTPPGGATRFTGDWTSDAPGATPLTLAANLFRVDPDFFGVYDIPILRGRTFDASDPRNAVLVGERLARMLWPGLDPVGRSFTSPNGSLQVIGLVKEIRFPSIDVREDRPQLYVALGDVLTMGMLGVRCAPCPTPLLVRQQLTTAARTVAPGVTVYNVKTLESDYAREFARPRAASALAFTFAATALIASAAGLFSLLSHSVTRRRRELGIRAALGASPADLRRLIRREGLRIAFTGIVLGSIAGLFGGRLLESLLFDVRMTDPQTWVIVAAILALTVAASSWHPTRVAIRAAPVVLLREE